MVARVEIYDVSEPDGTLLGEAVLGHVPRVGEYIILNAMGQGKRLRVERIQWHVDDGKTDELPQVELHALDIGWN